MDRRKLFLDRGYPSLFRYLVEELHMSEQAAYNRTRVARAVLEFPVILEHVRDGRLHLTGAKLLAPHLSPENCLELLGRAQHKTAHQIEELVADLSPQPAAPELVRRLPERSSPTESGLSQGATETPPATPSPAPQHSAAQSGSTSQRPPARRPQPLGLERFKVQFTADREFVELLDEVQSLMRHQVPDGNLLAVFGKSLRVLREELRRRKFGQSDRPVRRPAPR